jgi:tRNA (adenine22-N1)-methyltransferase
LDNDYCILGEEVLRENRFNYAIIIAERSGPVLYSAQELYFGTLHLQKRSSASLAKWQRLLRLKQRTLSHFARARQAVPEEQVHGPGRTGRGRWGAADGSAYQLDKLAPSRN